MNAAWMSEFVARHPFQGRAVEHLLDCLLAREVLDPGESLPVGIVDSAASPFLAATSQEPSSPVSSHKTALHILLQGPAGVGKHNLARLVAQLLPRENVVLMPSDATRPPEEEGAIVFWFAREGRPRACPAKAARIAVRSLASVERAMILTQALIPHAAQRYGISPQFLLDKTILQALLEGGFAEAGMHGAARKLERICQRASRELFQGVPLPNSRLLGPWLTLTLGTDAVSQDAPARVLPAGAVHAPLVSSQGGALACVSALGVVGTGQTRVTGAGPESEMMVQVARTRLLTLSGAFGVDLEVMKALDWHVHITGPAGPKDGASLGWPVLLAMASHLTGLKLPARYVHTGELGLNGEILPVGGIEEKVLACERQGLRRLFLPYGNRSDLDCLEPVAKGKLILVTIQQDADALKMLRVLSRRSS